VEEIPAAIVAANGIDVDAVTGATITSDAIKAAAAWALRETPFGKAEAPAPAQAPAEPAPVEPGEPVRSTGRSVGKNGDVVVEVVSDRAKIHEVTVTEQHETPGVGTVAVEWMPGRIVEANSVDVDAVTGATVTSDAIKAAVLKALKAAPYDRVAEGPAPAAEAAAPSGTAQITVGLRSWMSCPTVRSDWQKHMDAPFMNGATKFAENENAWKSGRTTKKESDGPTGAPKLS
jgi:uncharacterized protein with FMN-binding domain